MFFFVFLPAAPQSAQTRFPGFCRRCSIADLFAAEAIACSGDAGAWVLSAADVPDERACPIAVRREFSQSLSSCAFSAWNQNERFTVTSSKRNLLTAMAGLTADVMSSTKLIGDEAKKSCCSNFTKVRRKPEKKGGRTS